MPVLPKFPKPGHKPDVGLTPADRMKADAERRQRELDEALAQDKRDIEAFERVVIKHKLCVICAPDNLTEEDLRPAPPSIYIQARTAAEAIIRTNGRPIPTKHLWQKVIERGIQFKGSKSPESALAAYLHRYDKVQYLPGLGWWIAGVPWPPTNVVKSAQLGSDAPNGHAADLLDYRRRSGPEPSQFTQEVIRKTREFLADKIGPTPTGVIFQHLIEVGLTFPDNKKTAPQYALHGMLNHSKRFHSHGRAGWTLERKE